MPILVNGQLNQAALQIDDIYTLIIPPQTPLIPGVPTDGIGIVGTASRGTPNTPVPFGDPSSLVRSFGNIWSGTTAQPAIYDLVTEALGAMKQGASNFFGVRVTDGTDVASTGTIKDTSSTGGNPVGLVTFTASSTGTWGNSIQVTVGPGSNSVATPATASLLLSGSVSTTPGPLTVIINNVTVTVNTQLLDSALTAARNLSLAVNSNVQLSYYLGATVLPSSTTTSATIQFYALTSGTVGNGYTITNPATGGLGSTTLQTFTTLATGTGVQTYKVSVTTPNDPAELFDNISGGAGTGGASAAVAIVNAINNGIQGIRAPSVLVTAAIAGSPGTGNLSDQQIVLSGGSDGRGAVTANTLLGVDGVNRTGMYALRSLPIAQFGLAGGSSATDFQLVWPLMLAFAQSEGLLGVAAIPVGSSTSQAVGYVQTSGSSDWTMAFVKDFLWLNDTFNNLIRLVSPIGATLGKIATLSPEQSPGNKPILGYLGTERTGYFSPSGVFKAQTSYSRAELALLESNGILFMTQPAVGGNYLALRHGQNSSSDPTRNGINYSKLTPFIAKSLTFALGFAVDEVQTDALRRQVKSAISAFLNSMAAPGPGRTPMIGDVSGGPAYSVIVDNTNNSAATVAAGYMYVSVQVKYLSIVRFFVIQIEAGQSVTVRTQPNPLSAAA